MPRPREEKGVVNQPQPQPSTSGGKYDKLVDLSDLPEHYRDRITKIFDGFFSLGMKQSYWESVADSSPMFPNNLSTLSSPQLGDVLGQYTAWYAFAGDKLKYIAVAHNYIEQELASTLEAELGTMVESKGNIEAKKAKAKSTDQYKLIYSYIQKLKGMKTLLETEMATYDKCISTLSREVTRREHNAGF